MSNPKKDFVSVHYKLDADIADKLDAFCKVSKRKKTDVVETALSEYMAWHEPQFVDKNK